MARYLKVAAMSTPWLAESRMDGKNALKNMKNYWEAELAKIIPDKPDLIVLPEACDEYRLPAKKLPEYYRLRKDEMLKWFSLKARENNCYIACPVRNTDNLNSNSVFVIGRNGEIAGRYNKNHPVITENTEMDIMYGDDAPLIQCDFGTIGCAICFDLNFTDNLLKKYIENRPDLIVFCSAYHGGIMQNYWAFRIRAHFIGAVANNLPASIISPVGHLVAKSTNYYNYAVKRINLDCAVVHLDFNRNKLLAAKEKYGPGIKIFDPGHLGSVLLSSEIQEKNIYEIMQEFGIEILDNYIKRSLRHRQEYLKQTRENCMYK